MQKIFCNYENFSKCKELQFQKCKKNWEHFQIFVENRHLFCVENILGVNFEGWEEKISYDYLSAIGHTTFPPPSQKSVCLLVPPRDLGKIASESSLPELSNHV